MVGALGCPLQLNLDLLTSRVSGGARGASPGLCRERAAMAGAVFGGAEPDLEAQGLVFILIQFHRTLSHAEDENDSWEFSHA